MKICVVEDEKNIGEIIRMNLEMEGFDVLHFVSGSEALDYFKKQIDFSLVILDVMLPGTNGIDLCKFIRKTSEVPILFLSAKGTTTDRIEGLKAGGNDYLPKPFDLEELLLRISVLTNSTQKKTADEIQIGDFTVNLKTYVVENQHDGKQINLSKKEVGLIQLFNSNEGAVLSRSEILDKVWGKDQFPTTRTIDNFILNFRKIFEKDPKNPVYFHSIRGVGYKFTN